MSSDQVEQMKNENNSPSDSGIDISPEKDGGVLKKVVKEGEGDGPGLGSEVFVHYTGKLLSGEVFDSSRDRDQLFNFKLGEGMYEWLLNFPLSSASILSFFIRISKIGLKLAVLQYSSIFSLNS